MSNNNITVAFPGTPEWAVWWEWNSGLSNIQLDIVGFLALLGEGAVLANAQVSALSRLFFLPRLLPAPQALIRTSRPTTLPPFNAKVTGVKSGNVKDHVHHVAHILLGESMPTFTVRCVEVKKRSDEMRPPSRMDTLLRGTAPRRKATQSPELGPPLVKAKASGPMSWVSILCFIECVILFIVSIIFGDGMSLLTTLLLGGLSTVVGISNKWNLKLPKRPRNNAPPGDVVIRYPNGSYLVVRCDEDVARELYFAPEEIEYMIKNPTWYRMLSLLGTVLLMLGVITLANAKIQLQFAWALAYLIANVAHWIAAAVPNKMHWDLSCYEVREQGIAGGPKNPNFTEALWKAILFTKSTRWVKNGEAAPQTPVWDEWLIEAEHQANCFESHSGPLQDPIWKEGDLQNATIWDAPDKDLWDAKRAWDRLNEAYKADHPEPTPVSRKPPVTSSSSVSSASEKEAGVNKTPATVTIA